MGFSELLIILLEVNLLKNQSICINRVFWQILIFLIALFLGGGIFNSALSQNPTFSESQLESLVAPVALYPDDLLTNVLTASTVPGEISQAAQYLKNNSGKTSSMPDNDWDPSVKALLYFPDVLYKMNNDLNWTQNLGNAVINQMNDVINAVQAFRKKVMQAGNLNTNEQQKVVQDQNIIKIEPSNPEVIYVPEYEPTQVVNTGYPVAAFATGVAVSNWWHYRTLDWYNNAIKVYPPYISNYNYRQGGYYYNNYATRTGYNAPGTWRPVATPYDTGNTYRAGNIVRTGNTVRTDNTVNINTGGNTAALTGNPANRANTTGINQQPISTSNINAQLRQGFQNTQGGARVNTGVSSGTGIQRQGGGTGSGIQNSGLSGSRGSINSSAFGGISNGASTRIESSRGASSRSSFQKSGGGGRRR